MAEFKLDRIRFTWKDEWTPDTAFTKDDIVYYRGKTYACISAHTSSTDFFNDYGTTPRVSKVTVENEVFYLDGIETPILDLRVGDTYKFDVSDASMASTVFRFSNREDGPRNDGVVFETGVVTSGASGVRNSFVQIKIEQNTPNLFYYNTQELAYGEQALISSAKWRLIHDGTTFKKDWTSETYYTTGDVIKYKGYIYQCTKPHTSTIVVSLGPTADIEKWKIVATSYNWLNRWETDYNYDLGDTVTYNGITYECIEKHRSDADNAVGLEEDQGKWKIVSRSDNWLNEWTTETRYRVDDVVRYGAITYRCTTGHTSSATAALGLEDSIGNWEVTIEGIEYKFDWQQAYRYKKNDVVKSSHSLWICIAGHTSTTTLREDESNWQIWMPGLGYEELWDEGVEYKKGDIVLYGGYAYTALTNSLNSVPSVNGLVQDTGDWELLKQGYKHRGEWDQGTSYRTGDVVRNNGILYICLSDISNENPDEEIAWSILNTGQQWTAEWEDNKEYFIGDIATYESTSYVCTARHISTASASRPDLDILQTDQDYWTVLIQGTETNVLAYRGDLRTFDTETVRLPIGVPGEILKSENNLPAWANYEESTDVFYVATDGTDDEGFGLTLNAPFKTIAFACQYVKDNVPLAGINNFGYNITGSPDEYVLSRALEIMSDGTALLNASQLDTFLRTTNPRTNAAYFDITDQAGANPTADDITAAFNYFGGVPENSQEENLRIRDIVNYVYTNAESLADETVESSDGQTMTVAFQQRNVSIFIKTGQFKEVTPISIPRNTALIGDELRSTTVMPAPGYEGVDMFFVNNGSGIRNMTLLGLSGTLSEDVSAYGTRRPTAGAYVSLDPGQGPEDDSVWITNKSPYIQNVTTFGTGCIGQKIDGALHNGGNKSVTANDFTQILSDGIGYWAAAGGRSELVSVFTYYNYIGYLATEGGVLRGTNGNNSYGTFGARAEGVNPNETPIEAVIDNQSFEADVDTVYTNGSEILAFAYRNAGQHYSTAGLELTGSNVDFDASYREFRDEAIFQARLIDPADSSVPGGLNYQYLLNNAQGGDDRSITLAAADTEGTADKYVGLRIYIESGAGAGQYGYITEYDELTKRAIVSRDSDDGNGWDHIYPGYPIATVLDNTTRYSLEARSVVDEPLFQAEDANSGINENTDIAFGDGKWISISSTSTAYSYSTDGENWTTGNFPSDDAWSHIIYASGTWIVTSGNESQNLLTSGDGINWTARTFPNTLDNAKVAYSYETGVWLAVSTNRLGDTGVTVRTYYSEDNGVNWSAGGNLNNSGAQDVAYGNGQFVVMINNDFLETAPDDTLPLVWTQQSMASPNNVSSMTYGNGRFVIVTEGDNSMYSFDAVTWYEGDMFSAAWQKVSYGQGLFIATANDSAAVAHSQDGKVWRVIDDGSTVKSLGLTNDWGSIAFGNPSNSGIWVVGSTSGDAIVKVLTGARAFVRTRVGTGRIDRFVVYDPGSGYKQQPFMTIIDPEVTIPVQYDLRTNTGVLAQPEFKNRGSGYTRAIAEITGNGYADNYQNGNVIVVKNLTRRPGPGDNLTIIGIFDVTYRITAIEDISGSEPSLNATLRISPTVGNQESPEHETEIIIRQEYSQIRLTGHDFLDIGTGNFGSTKYPDLYLDGTESDNERQPFNEVTFAGGGRVFYTSTDQDGNFRVGELFEVEQSTGIVSVNADFFELGGLSELSLGGIQVGGTAVVVREFSKDKNFTANSNNIVPTQAAIISFLEGRISGGGSDAITNALIAGQVRISQNTVSTTSDLPINVLQKMTIQGGADGHYLASMFYGANQ